MPAEFTFQTKKWILEHHLDDNVVEGIVQDQYRLFKNKTRMLNQRYSLKSHEKRERRVFENFLDVASVYCAVLGNDLDYCDELFIQTFSFFYLICIYIFKEQRNSLLRNKEINIEYIQHMDNLTFNCDLILNNNSTVYSSKIKKIIHSFPNSIDPYSSGFNSSSDLRRTHRSLDPRVNEDTIRTINQLYPSNAGNSLQKSVTDYDSDNSASESSSTTSMNPIINTIDMLSFQNLPQDTYSILRIQKNASNQSINTTIIDPSSIADAAYFERSVIPKVKHPEYIIFFSESSEISDDEKALLNQLLKYNMNNAFWLEGGADTYRSVRHLRNHGPKIPDLKQLDLNSELSSSIPPIPLAKSVLQDNKNIQNHYFSYNHKGKNKADSDLISSVPPTSIPPQIPQLSLSESPSKFDMSPIAASHPHYSNEQSVPYPMVASDQHHGLNGSSSYDNQPELRRTQPALNSFTAASSRQVFTPLVGLKNPGSTCYINSMVQCLFSLNRFRKFFTDGKQIHLYMDLINDPNKLKLTSAIHEMFQFFYGTAISNNYPPVIDITRFLSVINKLNPSYNIPFEQQDTSQFLYYLIDQLHNELKLNYATAKKLNLLEINESEGEIFSNWQINKLKQEGFSYIQNLFGIKEEVSMKCSRCGYESVKYDTSIMMHLSFKGENILKNLISVNFRPEKMCEELGNAWDCDGCKKIDSELSKLQQKIATEHDARVAELKEKGKEVKLKSSKDNRLLSKGFFRKRHNKEDKKVSDFQNESTPEYIDLFSNTLSESEVETFEKYTEISSRPKMAFRTVTLLELPDILVVAFSVFSATQQNGKVQPNNLRFPETLDITLEDVLHRYKLRSWIDHWGASLDSGHFTSTIEYNNRFVTCDDEKISVWSETVPNMINNNNVYLLFYEKP